MGAWNYGIFSIIFTFTVVELFDNMGTLIGLTSKANLVKENGEIENLDKALTTDAVGTICSAIFGTSTVTSYIESAAGIAAGGKTGLTAVTVAVLFLISLFFAPLIGLVPGFATAPALVLVGALMMTSVNQVHFADFTDGLPAFLTIIMLIAAGTQPGILRDILAGKPRGTIFPARESHLKVRKSWLAFGRRIDGDIVVDAGCERAMLEDGSSLLAAGITAVEGQFRAGDTVRVLSLAGREIARGIVNYDTASLEKILGHQTGDFSRLLSGEIHGYAEAYTHDGLSGDMLRWKRYSGPGHCR